MDLERAILKIIRGEKKAPVASAGLSVLSKLYRFLIAARNRAYDLKLLPAFSLPVPVVSIGNVVVGGTGKTPLTHLLTLSLQKELDLAILTRGFKSQIEKRGEIRQISTGTGPLLSPEECGDEPYLLAQKTKASIWVGADRVASGKQAIQAGAECLLLDDGMQHRRLHRDVEIVLVDSRDPFSKERFLPYGLLRDSPKRLEKASLIVAAHIESESQFKRLKKQLAPFTSAPLVGAQIEVLSGKLPSKVGLFCGIGHPARFIQTVRDLKSEITHTLVLKDHDPLPLKEPHAFAQKCKKKGAKALVCTEKDAVKLGSIENCPLKIIPVKIEWKITFGKEHWENCVKHIVELVK